MARRPLRRAPGGPDSGDDSLTKDNSTTANGLYTIGGIAVAGLHKYGRVALIINPQTGAIEAIHPDAWTYSLEQHAQKMAEAAQGRAEVFDALDELSEPEAVAKLLGQGLTDDEVAEYLHRRDEKGVQASGGAPGEPNGASHGAQDPPDLPGSP